MVLTLLAIVMVIILCEGIRIVTNPLIQPEEKIREKLLKQTPLGTHMDDVIQLIKSKEDWKLRGIDYEHGFIHQGTAQREVIGEKSVRVHLGDYRIITNLYLATDVTVFFGFNENAELIDIWVWKTIDGL